MSNDTLDLNILAQNQEALLLTEAAAWLHDMGKCADAFLQPEGMGFNASSCQGSPRVNPHKAVFSPQELQQLSYWSNLSPNRGQCARLEEANHNTALWNTLNSLSLSVPPKNIAIHDVGHAPLQASFKEVVLWGRPLVADRYNDFARILGEALAYFAAVLGHAHKSAHMEKEDEADGGMAGYLTTPFGFVTVQIGSLDTKLSALLSTLDQKRRDLSSEIRKQFSMAPGDTRWPINEVTLWDWSSIVAALYKAELARCVLTGEQRAPEAIAWRLLSIRTDGLGYLFPVSSIPDLLARKRLLDDALNRVRDLLEETYPLGLEVYRDEDGSIFVVPDIDVLDLYQKDKKNKDSKKSLNDLIAEVFDSGGDGQDDLRGEVIPAFEVDQKAWKGQPASDELPPVSKHLRKQQIIKSDIQAVSGAWGKLVADICTVCGLRPQGPGEKATSRNVCDICERRRADRSEEWATKKLHTTIWTNEVADANGCLALIVGRFDLTHWLSGDLVRTLAVREPNDRNGHDADKVAKNPSFARVRRIWETTRQFWQEVCHTSGDLAESLIGEKVGRKGPRLAVVGTGISDIGPYHAYEMVLPKGVRLAVVWDKSKRRFITADNLEYLSGKTQLNEDIRNFLKKGKSFAIEEPSGYGEKNKVLGTLVLSEDAGEIRDNTSTYTPVIPILAEPRTFMALIPADKALQVATVIKEKYEREMGKVRNRLPLRLGLVFASRRTPLRAILDAGRQMLRQQSKPRGWEVICCARKQRDKGDVLPERFQQDANGQFKEWHEVTLECDKRRVCWYVPAMMGDGSTEDKWYPYVFLETGAEPTDRLRRYRTRNPWTDNDGWLVHAAELKVGDKICFTPSTFDFEFLDTTARRFEIHYDENGRRPRRTRPFYLEDLDRLETLWGYMKHLTKTQRHQVIRTIEATREAWYGQDSDSQSANDDVFKQFVHDTLAGAAWPKGQPWVNIPQEWQDKLIQAGVRGELADLAELHMEILKE